jgi:hypothetical protein
MMNWLHFSLMMTGLALQYIPVAASMSISVSVAGLSGFSGLLRCSDALLITGKVQVLQIP